MLQIDSKTLKNLVIGAANNLEKNKRYIDSLNVFPVPDGDTGTNMSLTMISAAKELSSTDYDTISAAADAFASAMLRGARGNSGVILSQLVRGFSKALKGKEVASTVDLAEGFKYGTDTAYKAVMKPKEGTILTVAREMSEYAIEIAIDTPDIIEFAKGCIEKCNESLNGTPELLPVLKQAGVVDSGGMGLLVALKGAFGVLDSENFDYTIDIESELENNEGMPQVGVNRVNIDTADIKFAYCTEFLVLGKGFNDSIVNEFKAKIHSIGDSAVVIGEENLIKVHVHTNTPGVALNEAVKLGDLSKIKIENMKEQHHNIIITEENTAAVSAPLPKKDAGFIAVSIGDGLNAIFSDLGVDYVISGGQTMNPSTDDILKAINAVNADTIYILPNNGNIILTANQAKEISEKNIQVISTKNIAQGIAAMIAFDANKSVEDNARNMNDAIEMVKVGEVTFAARETDYEDLHIEKGDYMGIVGKKIVVAEKELDLAVKQTIANLVDDDSSVISIYYGEDVNESDAKSMLDYVKDTYSDVDADIYSGGQPLYYYIVSVE